MTTTDPNTPDLRQACWRCQHYGTLVSAVHATCTLGPGSLQALPESGCTSWTPGPDDVRPADWRPAGYQPVERRAIWGRASSAAVPVSAPDWASGAPGQPYEAAAWHRQQEQQAWRTTDQVLGRCRRADVVPTIRIERMTSRLQGGSV